MTTMDESELSDVLSAIVQGMIIPDNDPATAQASLQVLHRVVSNVLKNPDQPKYKFLPGTNEKIKSRIVNVPGACEFLDAVGFVRNEKGDFELANSAGLGAAELVLTIALAQLPSPSPSPNVTANETSSRPAATSTPSTVDQDYEARRKEAEARQAQFQKKMQEDKKQRDMIRAQIKAEQREVKDRPVVASHAVSMQRSQSSGAASGDGKIRYVDSDREFQTILSKSHTTLVNFTASWCGPCQAIAGHVEGLACQNPHITFVKIDIDQNQETPSQFAVSAVPTFILFQAGQKVDEVKGANLQALMSMINKARA